MAGAGAIKAGDAYIEIGTRIGPRFKRGLLQAERALTKFSAKMALIGGAAAATAGIAAVTNEAAKFETQMAKVATLLDKDTLPLLEGMSRGVRKLSKEFGQGTGTLAEALFDIISATVPAAESLDLLAAGAKLAAAGVTTTKDATSAILTMMQVFPDEVRDAADAADFLFQVAKRGRTDLGQLVGSIGLVAPDARGATSSMIEMGAALAALTRGMGGNTAIAVTRLRTLVNMFITKPQKEAAQTAHDLEFELNSVTLRTIGLSGVLKKLSDNDATPEQIGRIFTMRRARSAVLTLLEQQVQLQKDLEMATNREGATAMGFAQIVDTLAFKWGQFGRTVVSTAVSLGQFFTPAVKRVVDVFREAIDRLDEFITANKGMGKVLGDAVGKAFDTIKQKIDDAFDSGTAMKFFAELVNGMGIVWDMTKLLVNSMKGLGLAYLKLFQDVKKVHDAETAKTDLVKSEARKRKFAALRAGGEAEFEAQLPREREVKAQPLSEAQKKRLERIEKAVERMTPEQKERRKKLTEKLERDELTPIIPALSDAMQKIETEEMSNLKGLGVALHAATGGPITETRRLLEEVRIALKHERKLEKLGKAFLTFDEILAGKIELEGREVRDHVSSFLDVLDRETVTGKDIVNPFKDAIANIFDIGAGIGRFGVAPSLKVPKLLAKPEEPKEPKPFDFAKAANQALAANPIIAHLQAQLKPFPARTEAEPTLIQRLLGMGPTMPPTMPPFADVTGRGMVGAGALSGATMPELNAADTRQVDQEISLLTEIRNGINAILEKPEPGVAV